MDDLVREKDEADIIGGNAEYTARKISCRILIKLSGYFGNDISPVL
jgi:hypothetical protein